MINYLTTKAITFSSLRNGDRWKKKILCSSLKLQISSGWTQINILQIHTRSYIYVSYFMYSTICQLDILMSEKSDQKKIYISGDIFL